MAILDAFHPDEMISLWEEGAGKSSIQRSDALISLYLNALENEPESRSNYSIERREQLLLEIRKILFGRKFLSLATCPQCSETIEWEMNYSDFKENHSEEQFKENRHFQVEGYDLHYHLPYDHDLWADSKFQILSNCLIHAKKDNQMMSKEDVPSRILEKLEEEMEANSPLSSAMINLSCPECEHQWSVHFSVYEFLWTELDQWVRRLLYEISTLAQNFGWSEHELLHMNPVRRSYYLSTLAD